MKFDYSSAYTLLTNFRDNPEAVSGLFKLAVSDVYITNEVASQLLLGTIKENLLISTIYNFSKQPLGELFNSLCAVCSSHDSILNEHQITSSDNNIISGFKVSNLEKYVESFKESVDGLNMSITAKITYPQ